MKSTMYTVFSKDGTYNDRYSSAGAIHAFIKRHVKKYPDIAVYLNDEMIEWLQDQAEKKGGSVTFDDTINGDGSYNYEWSFSINYEDPRYYDYTYISLKVREPETTPDTEPETTPDTEPETTPDTAAPVKNAAYAAALHDLDIMIPETYTVKRRGSDELITKTVPALFDPERVRASYTNGKTGIISVSLLAGDMAGNYPGSVPETFRGSYKCGGSCHGTCPGCYALAMTRYPEVFLKFLLNTVECRLDPVRFFELIDRELYGDPWTAPRVVRLHDSGDFINPAYTAAAMAFISRHPDTRFGSYTKAAPEICGHGLDNIPDNFTLSCSPWPGYCDPIGNLPQFCYDDGTDPALKALSHCPAVDKNGNRTGITCIQCRHCYTAKPGDKWAVYAH